MALVCHLLRVASKNCAREAIGRTTQISELDTRVLSSDASGWHAISVQIVIVTSDGTGTE